MNRRLLLTFSASKAMIAEKFRQRNMVSISQTSQMSCFGFGLHKRDLFLENTFFSITVFHCYNQPITKVLHNIFSRLMKIKKRRRMCLLLWAVSQSASLLMEWYHHFVLETPDDDPLFVRWLKALSQIRLLHVRFSLYGMDSQSEAPEYR
jgi:hypothetical protein